MTVHDPKPGGPIWIDLMTSDPGSARAFYGDLFGWKSTDPDPEMGGYFNFLRNDQPAAGGMTNPGAPNMPDSWNIYLQTDDAKATEAAAVAGGATVIVPATDVAHLGTMAVFIDVGGAAIGAWQPKEHRGFSVVDEPGAPSWFELHTPAYDASVKFYQDVFKWETDVVSDAPDFRYTTLGGGDAQQAGIMDATAFLPPNSPGRWYIYFDTPDVDASLRKTVELGGTVAQPAEDTPYGRMAAGLDPTGALFKLRTAPGA